MTVTIETPFTQGEVPLAALTYQYLDGDGVALTLDDTWTATLRIKHSDGTTVDLDADLDTDLATASYDWGDAPLDTAGVDRAEFWITNGTQEIASDRILWRVRAAIPTSGS